jgi:lipid II:glycine glycyltransferase (peptidoglycan interpeptide bridge formation enzyme)
MRVEVIPATGRERREWDDFVVQQTQGSFLQAWSWGDFQEALGLKVRRLKILGEGKMLGVCQIIERTLLVRRLSWYAPRGPVLRSVPTGAERDLASSAFQALVDYIRHMHTLAPQAIFWRIDPAWPQGAVKRGWLRELGLQKSRREIQPRDTLILSLEPDEDTLLRQMHEKTRYNIRLSRRRMVKVVHYTDAKHVDEFWQLAQEVERRGRFYYYPRSYYETLMKVLGQRGQAHLFVARWKKRTVAAIILVGFGNTLTYVHGASAYRYRAVMAPHLLHWEAIRWAKEQGYRYYDFFGIAPANVPRHPWAGITRFKLGFGGRTQHYIGTWDLAFDANWYEATEWLRLLRRLFR